MREISRPPIAVAATVAGLLLFSGSASAAPPANDDFANAQALALGSTVDGTTVESTLEAGEPNHSDGPFPVVTSSVWYAWQPGATPPERVHLETCGSEQGGLALYEGSSLGALTRVAVTFGCRLTFEPEPGVSYRIAVLATTFSGQMAFELTLRLPEPPSNDAFADAEALTLGSTVDGTLLDSTIEPGEPDHTQEPALPATGSVWYRWNSGPTPPSHVRMHACVGGGATLAVYQGTALGALTRVTDQQGCEQTFAPLPNTAYRIAAYHMFPTSGTFSLTSKALTPPHNDDFSDAEELPPTIPQLVSGTGADSTRESGEPIHGASSSSGSVWYAWTPTDSVGAKIEICDPEGRPNPGIGVYTGDSVSSLTQVARTDGGFDCTVEFDASASTTYRIAVTGGAPFEFTLRPSAPPPNDDLDDAAEIPTTLPQAVDGTLDDATYQQSEPNHASGTTGPPGPSAPDGSVWYRWASGSGGETVVDGCDWQTGGVTVAVYTGSSYAGPEALQPAAPNDGRCRQRFTAAPETTYRIAVQNSREGAFQFEMHALDPPANDDLASAQLIASGPPRGVAGTTVDADAEPGEPSHGAGPSSSVWYRWNSGAGGPISMNACLEQPGMLLAVYTGTNYSNLSRVAGGDGRCLVHFVAPPNTGYRIAVDTQLVQEPFLLAIWQSDPPPNDAFAAAQTLDGAGPLAISGTNVDATTEPGEPGHGQQFGEVASVWYAWTAPSSPAERTVTVDTCDSDFFTRLFVYTGASLGSLTEQAQSQICDDDSAPWGDRATFTAIANQTYLIRIAGYGQDAEGNFTLRLDTEGVSVPGGGGGGGVSVTPPPAEPVEPKKKCKKGKRLKKGKCVKKKRKKRRR